MSGWGLGYFRVNAEGHVTVHPDANKKRGLDLYNLAMDLHAQGVGLPLLLRNRVLRIASGWSRWVSLLTATAMSMSPTTAITACSSMTRRD